YVEDFRQLLGDVVQRIGDTLARGISLAETIVRVHLEVMSEYPDSLIARRLGTQAAREAADRAHHVLSLGQPGDEAYERGLSDLDFWLRALGHKRNPGTTADLIAAGLFAALRDGIIKSPYKLAREWRDDDL